MLCIGRVNLLILCIKIIRIFRLIMVTVLPVNCEQLKKEGFL